MIESKKSLVVLDSNHSNAPTKRSPFHLLSSIFSKKKPTILESEALDKSIKYNELQRASSIYDKHHLNTDANVISRRCATVPGSFDDGSGKKIEPNFLSPISTSRKKNLKIDLETLHLSRQDNPYLKQLERRSLPEETILSCADINSLAEKALFQGRWALDSEQEIDIHQHLVRSPPPNFPQNITHFIYSQANSPKRQINQASKENLENFEVEKNKKAKSLNPILTKKELGRLDPSIKEVLEYQKTQLIAGIQHSFSIGQIKFGTAPAHCISASSNLYHNSQVNQVGWRQDSESCFTTKNQTEIPQGASSFSGLSSSCFDLDQAFRKTPLGPIKIGRTLSGNRFFAP